MNVEEIRNRVDALRGSVESDRGDEETWHREQDSIMAEALQAIADGVEDPQAIATEALKVEDISFARWYA